MLALEYQKHTLIGTMEHYTVNNDKYSGLLLTTEIIISVREALTCLTNILLNDYTTAQLRVIKYQLQRLTKNI